MRNASERIALTFFLFAKSGRIVLTRLRLLITSVLSEIGRGLPCSLRNKPQALHRTEPNSSRRHNGVVEVLQFWQVGCVDPLVAIMVPVVECKVSSVQCNAKAGGRAMSIISTTIRGWSKILWLQRNWLRLISQISPRPIDHPVRD
jgi:hypothetical protein